MQSDSKMAIEFDSRQNISYNIAGAPNSLARIFAIFG